MSRFHKMWQFSTRTKRALRALVIYKHVEMQDQSEKSTSSIANMTSCIHNVLNTAQTNA